MPTKLSFHERMTGYFAVGANDPRVGDELGRRKGTEFGFEVDIVMDDLDRFLADPAHTATVTGVYLGNMLEPAPVMTKGVFNFMSQGPGGSRLMEHHHEFVWKGETYRLDGYKYLDDDPLAFDAIADLTTLYCKIRDAKDKVVAAGVLHFPMKRFAELVASFQSSGDDDPVTARTKFLELFLGDELKVLLNGFHQPPAPPTVRRSLVRPHHEIAARYDVVIVGSGYGGGVAAARLASWKHPVTGRPRSVCVLERGKEWRAGDFPDQPWEFASALRTPVNPDGLFDFTTGPDIDVLVGNGLGGTSLINANVMIEADPDVFALPQWRDLGLPSLKDYYERARKVIHPQPHPALPLKGVVFQDAAKAAGGTDVRSLPLAVAFDSATRQDTGNAQTACTNCGGCVTGCNFTAKSTVDMTYLSIAQKAGTPIFAGIEVRSIARADDGSGEYVLHCTDRENGAARLIRAGQVVLAAGALGTFGILARSQRDHGLALSPALGQHFTGNGDVLGFGYNTDRQTAINVGPTITSMARYDPVPGDVTKRFIVEEGGVPQALMAVLRKAIPLFVWNGVDTDSGWADKFHEWSRKAADLFWLQDRGALNHSEMFFGMGFEDTAGTLKLEGDRVRVAWPQVRKQPFATAVDDAMLALTTELGGTYIDNPDPRSFLTSQLVTVHPLGGCAMGASPQHGVVNHRGEVFGHEDGLYVADGSIMPTPLGANPALTIAALAEYIVECIANRWTAVADLEVVEAR